jgi:hypothetical protein
MGVRGERSAVSFSAQGRRSGWGDAVAGLIFSNRYATDSYHGGLIQGATPLELRLLDTVAFVAPGTGPNSDFPLAQAWDRATGFILLLGAPASDPMALGQALLDLEWTQDAKLVWIANPNDPPADWIYAAFALEPDAPALKRAASLDLTREKGGYRLRFGEGTNVGLQAENDSLIFSGPGMGFGRGQALLEVEAAGVTLALAEQPAPTFRFGFGMAGGDALTAGLDSLGVGLWYTRPGETGGRQAFRYPLFQRHPGHDGLACTARITPARLRDPAASNVAAIPVARQPSYYVTWFRSVFGRSVLVGPDSGGFGLVFNATTDVGLGMTPHGRFRLRFSDQAINLAAAAVEAAAKEAQEFACGGVGTERIAVAAELTGNLMLELRAGCPGAVTTLAGETKLTDATTTAWARLWATGGELTYQAQPSGQAAYFVATGNDSGTVPMLPYLPIAVARIGDGEQAPFWPMVPLAGLERASSAPALALETTAIAPARKAILDREEAAREDTGDRRTLLSAVAGFDEVEKVTAVTPGGLEASFIREDGVERWEAVELARLLATVPGNAGRLRFAGAKGVVEPLRAALLTSQQFLVVSDPTAILPFFAGDDAKVTLRGWEFLLDPATWSDHGTILIVKNTPVALQSLLGDTGAWTSAGAFNRNATAVSRRLLAIAAEARASLQDSQARLARFAGEDEPLAEPDLQFFVDTVLDSPDWNGVLFLNAGLGRFPNDLAGMRAGLDPDRLYAHHLGVTQTPFTTLAELQNRSSSMFGLIRYDSSGQPKGNGLEYVFRVRELGVRFADSDIRDFRATVDLSLGPMFGQRATLEDGRPAVSEMVGARHRRGDEDVYAFTAGEPIRLKLGTGPLQGVDLLQGEFATESVSPLPGGETKTVFNFAGALRFDCVSSGEERYDLFSFDELAFSNLAIHMDFRNDLPRKPNYAFSIGNLQLSESLSRARRASLYEGLPLKLGQLVEGAGKPDALGNMNVQLPVPPRSLPKAWYGLTQVLDMGSLSDIAGTAGLEAKLLVAWGPAAGQFYVGLNISGLGLSGSASELSLLGVLKLKVYALALRHQGEQWALLMSGMTLGVFSKTLPPGGAFELYVFGVPDPSGSAKSLGWYGAWVADEKKKTKAMDGLSGLPAADAPAALPVITGSPRLRFRDVLEFEGD